MAVIINGRDLTIEQVISVCRHHEKVELAPEAIEAVNKARAYVEKKVAEKAVVYDLQPVSVSLQALQSTLTRQQNFRET